MLRKFWILTSILITFAACSHNPPVETSGSPTGQVFVGLASFYTSKLAGQTTASGTTYQPNQMTAAHRTLPFGTHVLVTNLDNNKSVVVTVEDRGPESKDRIIDVSLAAAQALDMLTAAT